MSSSARPPVDVAVVGLEFGAEFAPIYADHPDVGTVTVCDLDGARAADVAERFGSSRTAPDLDAVLADDSIDAVHLVTGLRDHAEHTVRALEAGKHVACTVPMGLTIDELRRIVDAKRAAGRTYMMMETAVYTREFLYVRDLVRSGAFGTLSYGRGTHFQDMSGWPSYWRGLPPMHYMTHAVAPLLSLIGTRASSVRALGSGRLTPEQEGDYGNPFPVETAIFTLADSDVVIDITRSLHGTARSYTESFSLYGDQLGFEWPQLEGQEEPVLFEAAGPRAHRGRDVDAKRQSVPDRADLLPPSIARYTRQFVHAGSEHRSFVQGGGHGGSHPHLVHEFIDSIVTGRRPVVDEIVAADWTAAGICAHESAMAGGAIVPVPSFSRP